MIRKGSLLIVDDNEANRDVLSRRLAMNGYAVTVAASGVEALACVAAAPYDLVLLDVEMPSMSGFDVLGRIRETHSSTQLPVIMVTARTDGADIVEAFRLGANDYVTKPIDFPVALARIGTHLSHKHAVEDLHDSEERYALAMQGANDGLWDWNLITNEVHWSVRWKAMLGYDDSAIGTSPDEWFTRVHRDDLDRVDEALQAHLTGGTGYYESEHRILHRNGTFRWVLCRGAAIRNVEGAATRLAGSLTDITDAKVSDTLTGLPNRLLFVDLIERAIKRTERHRDYVFGLLVLGLDQFRMVGDSLGPLTADRLLVAVANRLQSSLNSPDSARPETTSVTLARIAGDEFTVLVDDIADVSEAVALAERLRRALEKPFDIEGHQLFTSATVGIAISTTGYRCPEEILRDAASSYDAIITSGGVSMGEYDVVKAVLSRIADMRWMQIAIKPAKPFAFGLLAASRRQVPVFGLPGNPVSSMVSFELFARPALRKMMGHAGIDRPTVVAIADEVLRRQPDGKTHYMRVSGAFGDDGRYHVRSVGAQGSHQLAATSLADAIAIVPDGDGIQPGDPVTAMLLSIA